MTATQFERFWSRVQVADQSGCWEWTGPKNHGGYGRWGATLAHRAAYQHYRGDLPNYKANLGADRCELDHLCRNRACVNPAHLEIVTRKENFLRGEGPKNTVVMQAARRAQGDAQTHCPQGHLWADNMRVVYTKKGIRQRFCRRCATAAVRRWEAKLKLARQTAVKAS